MTTAADLRRAALGAVLVLCATFISPSTHAAAILQAQPPAATGQPAAAPVPIDSALRDLHAAYHDKPFAERISITVRRPGPTPASPPIERRDEAVIRFDPGKDASGPRLLLSLGDLRFAVCSDHLTAVHTRDPGTYFRQEFHGPLTASLLARLLPPLPFPQLDLALAATDAGTNLTPYLDNIHWDAAAVDSIESATRLTITGTSAGRHIEIIASPEGRIREFSAELAPATSGAQPPGSAPTTSTLRLRCTPLDLAPDTAWDISTDGRTRVASLADLRARPGDLHPGDTVPNLSLSTPDGRAWSLGEDLGPLLPDDPLTPRPCLILLLVRQPAEADTARRPTDPDLSAAIAAITDLLNNQSIPAVARPATETPPPPFPPRCAYRPALVFDLSIHDLPDRIKAAAAAPAWGPRVLWTASAATTIDRLVPPAKDADATSQPATALIAIIDADRILKAVIPVAADLTRDKARAAIDAALGPPAPPPGP